MRLINADTLIADCQLAQKQADRHGREFANAFYSGGGEVSTEWWCVEDMIENAPTIEPQPHWIPCSERLPEENGQYLITVKYVHVDGYDDIYAEHGEWTDGKWDMFCFGHCGKVENIIAWMPLPESYREGAQE